MAFTLSPKITKKYGAYDSNEVRQENRSRRVPYGRVELDFNSNYGYHERNISGNYSLAIGYDYDYETYGPCIPDQEIRGGCLYARRKLNPELSYALYEKKGDSFKLVFKSDPFNPFKTEKDGHLTTIRRPMKALRTFMSMISVMQLQHCQQQATTL